MNTCLAFTPYPVFPYRRPNKTPIAIARALGLELQAPFPKGYTLEQGD
jgi:hypothetical protein